MARLSTLAAASALALAAVGPGAVRASSSSCVASTDAAYTFQISPLADFVFYWTLDGATLKGQVVYDGAAWVAVGPSGGDMVGSEVVLGLPRAGTVLKYSLTAENRGGVDEMAASHQTLSATSITSSSAATTMTFEKLVSESGELDISTTAATTFVFAYGPSTAATALGYHSQRGAVAINLATCDATTVSTKALSKAGVLAHAALMVGAWMWLVPAGVLAAVYKHKLGPGWLQLHAGLQTAAFVTMLCAYLVMFFSIEDAGDKHFGEADTAYGDHTLLGGLALFLMAVYQVLSGALRPAAHVPLAKGQSSADGVSETNGSKPWPRRAFEVTHKAMGRAAPLVALLAVLSGVAWADAIGAVDGGGGFVAAALVPFGGFAAAYAYKVATMGL